MNHVVIIGFMGSGKTRVGKQLSKDLGLSFVDLERLITRKMNMSAREIFQRFGEPYYRALETVALKQFIQDSERRVISLGAGLPLQRDPVYEKFADITVVTGEKPFEELIKEIEEKLAAQ